MADFQAKLLLFGNDYGEEYVIIHTDPDASEESFEKPGYRQLASVDIESSIDLGSFPNDRELIPS